MIFGYSGLPCRAISQCFDARVNILITCMSVEPELKISVHPEVAKVCAGSKAVLTCQVDCSCPGITMEWTLAQGVALPPGPEVCVTVVVYHLCML